jgi:hypothetical protein
MFVYLFHGEDMRIIKAEDSFITQFENSYHFLRVSEEFYPGVKRPERETDHSPPSRAEFKNAWRCTSTPIRLKGVVLNYHTMKKYPLLN